MSTAVFGKAGVNWAISSPDTGSYTTTSGSLTTVTNSSAGNLSATLVCKGTPIFAMLVGDGTSSSYVEIISSTAQTTANAECLFKLLEDGTGVRQSIFGSKTFYDVDAGGDQDSGQHNIRLFPESIHFFVQAPDPGANVYTLQVQLASGSATLNIVNCDLLVYEI